MRNKVLIWSGISFFVLLVGMAYYVFMANAIVTSEYMKLQEKNVAISNIEKQKENEKNVLTEENKKMSEEMQLNFSKYKVVYLTFDDGPTPTLHSVLNVVNKHHNALGVLGFLNCLLLPQQLAQHMEYYVVGIAQIQIPPSWRSATEAGDQYKWHVFDLGTAQTLNAVATWNPCHHCIQLKIESVLKKLGFDLRSQP